MRLQALYLAQALKDCLHLHQLVISDNFIDNGGVGQLRGRPHLAIWPPVREAGGRPHFPPVSRDNACAATTARTEQTEAPAVLHHVYGRVGGPRATQIVRRSGAQLWFGLRNRHARRPPSRIGSKALHAVEDTRQNLQITWSGSPRGPGP